MVSSRALHGPGRIRSALNQICPLPRGLCHLHCLGYLLSLPGKIPPSVPTKPSTNVLPCLDPWPHFFLAHLTHYCFPYSFLLGGRYSAVWKPRAWALVLTSPPPPTVSSIKGEYGCFICLAQISHQGLNPRNSAVFPWDRASQAAVDQRNKCFQTFRSSHTLYSQLYPTSPFCWPN